MSGICLPLSNGLNVCTSTCGDGGQCVPGWSCESVPGQVGEICSCSPSAEVCNGKDDDCNGIVDDEPAVEEQCAGQEGAGSVCENGACTEGADGGIGDGGDAGPASDGGDAGSFTGPRVCASIDPIDFGLVDVASTATQPVVISNCGSTDLTLGAVTLGNDTLPHAFALTGAPTTPASFRVGDSFTLNVSYSPASVEVPPAPGDSGSLSITTEAGSLVVPLEGRGQGAGCGQTPTASIQVSVGGTVIDPTSTNIDPLTSVTLNGSSSLASADGSVVSFTWSFVSEPPTGAPLSLSGTTAPEASLYLAVVGDYVVKLVVSTAEGCSATAQVTLHVVPSAAVYVQLTWPQSYGDLDLHYIGPGGSFYEMSPYDGDLDWEESLGTAYGPMPPTPTGATSPDWGGPGNYPDGGGTVAPDNSPIDDPAMPVDQRQGYGPEAAEHQQPFDGTYKITVHYYCSDDSEQTNPGAATAVVNVYVHGSLAWHGLMPGMQQTQAWDAADLVVANGGMDISVMPLTGGLYETTEGCFGSGGPDAGTSAPDAGGSAPDASSVAAPDAGM
jgi:hypothetical protein